MEFSRFGPGPRIGTYHLCEAETALALALRYASHPTVADK